MADLVLLVSRRRVTAKRQRDQQTVMYNGRPCPYWEYARRDPVLQIPVTHADRGVIINDIIDRYYLQHPGAPRIRPSERTVFVGRVIDNPRDNV